MKIKIYDAPKSGHCHRVRLAASLMRVPYTIVPISGFEGERKGTAFLAINPLGQIPVIEDGDTVLRDSNAIIIYLAEKYAPDTDWIPDDVVARARMHEWLAVAAGAMYRGPNMARLIKLFGKPADYAEAAAVSDVLFNMMDKHLQRGEWLVGDQPTLADIACYSYIAVANEGDLDITPFSSIRKWLTAVEGLDRFVPMTRS